MKTTIRYYIVLQLVIYLQFIVFFLKPFGIASETDFAKNISTVINFIFYSCSIALCIYLRGYIYNILKQTNILLFILAYGVLSTFWSPLPEVSTSRAFNLILQVIQILSIFVSALYWNVHIVSTLKKVTFVIILLNVLFYILMPDAALSVALGENGRYDCLMPSPNNLAQIAILTFAFHIPKKVREIKLHEIIAITLSFFCLYLSGSATGLICIILLVFLNISLQIQRKWRGVIVSFILLFTISSTLIFSEANIDIFGLFNRDANLTGRTVIWASVLVDIERDSREIFGYGIGGFWDASGKKSHSNDFLDSFMQAHNGYLDTYLQLGLVGCFLFLILIIHTIRLIVNNFYKEDFRIICLVLVAVLVNNLTESSFLSPKHPNWLIFTIFYIMLAYASIRSKVSNRKEKPYSDQTKETIALAV